LSIDRNQTQRTHNDSNIYPKLATGRRAAAPIEGIADELRRVAESGERPRLVIENHAAKENQVVLVIHTPHGSPESEHGSVCEAMGRGTEGEIQIECQRNASRRKGSRIHHALSRARIHEDNVDAAKEESP
jgi:hypothetical protein